MNFFEKAAKYADIYYQEILMCLKEGKERDKDEILFKKAESNLSKFYEMIDHHQFDNKYPILQISNDETYLFAMQILHNIFGPSISNAEFDIIKGMLLRVGGNNPYYGSYALDVKTGKRHLLFERFDTLDTIPVLTHESTHYLQDQYASIHNYFHREILAMLVELITAYELTNDVMDPNLYKKCVIERFKSFVHLMDEKDLMGMFVSEVYEEADDFVVAHQYLEDTLYMYVVDFIYAYNLFLHYKDDKKTLLTKIRDLFIEGDDITRITKFYGIDFTKDKPFDEVIKLAKSVAKK